MWYRTEKILKKKTTLKKTLEKINPTLQMNVTKKSGHYTHEIAS